MYYLKALRTRRPPIAYIAQLGDVTFTPSVDHQTLTSYEGRVRAAGTSSPILATQNLGHPTPIDNVITVNMATTLNALAAGDYEVTVAAISAGGTTDSVVSNSFTVPLA